MRKAVKYKIVHSDRPQQVEGEVNRLLQEGWELHGSLCDFNKMLQKAGCIEGRDYHWSQALVLKEGQDKPSKPFPP